MRLIITIVFTSFISTAFSQSDFRDFLRTKYPTCYVSDGTGGWTFIPGCTAVTQEDSLDFQNVFSTAYYDQFPITLVDLQYFTALKYLNGSNNRIYSIDAFPPNTEKLILVKTSSGGPAQGPYLPSLPASLLYFDCDSSFFTPTLPALPASLKYLNCSHNKILNLPAFPSSLDTLISSNQLEYQERYPEMSILPSLPLTLKYLDCHANALLSLPVLPPTLQYLDCSDQWTVLSYPGSWKSTLTSLPDLPAALEYLNCSSNKLTLLPLWPASLQYLYCARTRFNDPDYGGVNEGISSLSQLPDNLRVLDCSIDNISCLPHLPASLTYLYTSGDSINCLPNSGSYISTPSLPVCNATNNSNQCVSERIISRTFFYDNNGNGIHDAGENYKRNAEVISNSGSVAYSNNNGYFEFSGVLGTNTIDVVVPAGYISVPATSTYTFTTDDTIVHAMYALQPVSSFDSVAVSVVPVTTARFGTSHVYRVDYENVGTTAVNAIMQFKFDQQLMSFQNSSVADVTLNNGILSIPAISVTPGEAGSLLMSFLVTGFFGDTIHVNIKSTANSNISVDSAYSVIRGSFDPNDKNATPQLSNAQVASGTYINYTIRFQNTGNDTAFHVVVTDLLNGNLNPASFQILQTSHSCKTTRVGNLISFEFLNILLPDSNVNEPLSHGYIRFRVKPNVNVTAGAVIPNDANIYFDYNAPVLTNTAETNIEPGVVPLKLLSLTAMTDAFNNASLTWTTAEEINTAAFDIERSDDGINFVGIGSVAAIGNEGHKYQFHSPMRSKLEYFRLKMLDLDRHFEYSPVVHTKMNGKGNSFQLLSNPVAGKLSIQLYDESLAGTKAYVIDNTGRRVVSFNLQPGRQDIDLGSLQNGAYILVTAKESIHFLLVKSL